ncbi:MAG: hypothetical protein J2P24_21020, partial [Streptosporangiales bacterium]|nr:hypothetical protein [Streptosporangiales bacterium]
MDISGLVNRHRVRKKSLSMLVAGVTALVVTGVVAVTAGAARNDEPLHEKAAQADRPLGANLTGRQTDGSVLTPDNQYVTPAGDSIEHSGRPLDLAVRPDGKTSVDLTKAGGGLFTVVDLVDRKVLQQYTPPRGVGSGNVSVRGLLYSEDGNT